MDKRTSNKRKSLGNTNTTPNKLQKTAGTPVSQKKNKSPKSANKKQKTPQNKQSNGKQTIPKEKKKPEQEDDETELMSDSDENETDNSIEGAENNKNGNNDNSGADDSNEDDKSDEEKGESDEENEDKEDKPVEKEIATVDRKFSVYVAGFDYAITESLLENVFDDTNVLSTLVLRNPINNKSKGCGFVNFKDEASVEKALLKNGTEVNGRTITVTIPMKKDKHTDAKSKKRALLQKIQKQVQSLEKELYGAGKKNKPYNKTFVKQK